MRKGFKRLLGGLMALVMVLSLVMVSPSADKSLVKAGEETTIEIPNADFEADSFWNDWGWTCESGVYSSDVKTVEQYTYADNEWLTVPSTTSTKSAKFWSASADTLWITATKAINLEAGTYTYHVNAMGANAAIKFSLGNNVTGEAVALEGWNVWTDATGTLTVSEDMEAWIGVEIAAEDDGYGYIDSISLTKQVEDDPEEDEDPEETPVIENGDFEADSEDDSIVGWTKSDDTNASVFVTADEWMTNNLTQMLKIDTYGIDSPKMDLTNTVEGVPAGTYYVSFDTSGADMVPGITVSVLSGSTVLATKTIDATTGYNSWATTIMDDFTLTEKADITISIRGDLTAGYWGTLDNFVLVKKEVVDLSAITALMEKVPENYETDGFTADSVAALKAALAKAEACTEESGEDEVEACAAALEEALAALVYEDDVLTVEKVNGITDDFIKGVDISSYITEVNSGVVYKDWNGNAVNGVEFIKLFADTGVNYIRLRVWNQPYEVDANGNPAKDENGNVKYYGGGNNDLEVTKEICEMIAAYNEKYNDHVKVLIDLQYSDFWADPEKQTAPKAWADITDIDELTEKVKEFTIDTLEEIATTGVEIGMVQVGNETNTGICGRSEGSSDYYAVFKAGCEAVKEFDENVLRVVHFTDPQSASKADHFAGSLYSNGVDYDVYATSYYPFWHGTTDNLYQVLKNISTKYDKMVMVAETQYPYTNDDYDGSDNQAYEGKDNIDLSKWPVSLQGQANEIRDVINAVAKVGEKGIGMFYWEPAWLGVGNAYDEDGNLDEEAYKANQEKWNTYGSGWASEYAAEYDLSAEKWGYGGTNNENASLFDFTGNPNATLNVFKYVNYGSVSPKSFYSMDGVEGGTVLVGATADEILAELPTEADFLYNDKTTGTAKITWNTDSLNEAVKKVSTTAAIGNTYLVSGTITVDGETHTVSAEIGVEPSENLVVNGDFEKENAGEWKVINDTILFLSTDGENPRNGSNGCVTFNTYNVGDLTADANGCYAATLSQTIKNLPAGVYEARTYFEGLDGAGKNTGEHLNIFAVYGDTTKVSDNVTLYGWMTWQTAVISDIVITEEMVEAGTNSVTLYANVSLLGDTWGSIDDFYLYRTGDVQDDDDQDGKDNKDDKYNNNNNGTNGDASNGNNFNGNSTAGSTTGNGSTDQNETTKDSNSANTGDQSPILPFVLILFAGCAVVAGVVVKRKAVR